MSLINFSTPLLISFFSLLIFKHPRHCLRNLQHSVQRLILVHDLSEKPTQLG